MYINWKISNGTLPQRLLGKLEKLGSAKLCGLISSIVQRSSKVQSAESPGPWINLKISRAHLHSAHGKKSYSQRLCSLTSFDQISAKSVRTVVGCKSIWRFQSARPQSAAWRTIKNPAPCDCADWFLVSSTHQVSAQSDKNCRLWNEKRGSPESGQTDVHPIAQADHSPRVQRSLMATCLAWVCAFLIFCY